MASFCIHPATQTEKNLETKNLNDGWKKNWFAKCDRVRQALVPTWGWLVTFWLICEFFLEWKCFLTFCFSSVKKLLKDLDWSWILAWSSYVTNCYDKFYKEQPVPVWNYFRIRESSAPVLRKQSESWRTASLLYFNNLWTLVVSMKEPTMSWWLYGRFFNSFPSNLRNMVICQNQSLWFHENCDYESSKNHPDNHRGLLLFLITVQHWFPRTSATVWIAVVSLGVSK